MFFPPCEEGIPQLSIKKRKSAKRDCRSCTVHEWTEGARVPRPPTHLQEKWTQFFVCAVVGKFRQGSSVRGKQSSVTRPACSSSRPLDAGSRVRPICVCPAKEGTSVSWDVEVALKLSSVIRCSAVSRNGKLWKATRAGPVQCQPLALISPHPPVPGLGLSDGPVTEDSLLRRKGRHAGERITAAAIPLAR